MVEKQKCGIFMQENHFSPYQVLLVEDDRTHRELITAILERAGCHVTIARNGKDALRRIMSMPYNVILMDVEMPELNGLETTRILCDLMRQGDLERTPVIAMTSRRDPAIEQCCREAGMVDFIPKDLWRPKWEPFIRDTILRWAAPQADMESRQA